MVRDSINNKHNNFRGLFAATFCVTRSEPLMSPSKSANQPQMPFFFLDLSAALTPTQNFRFQSERF
ncbi:unnamed protein product [Brugia pahangi]|uniref:Uncharacterized protein n=1 Tax=Brugia pahangi TaxID=6280 RepID=A0A0N4T321_BRUPA|nr:unnamed protein product [Brugia pahangi]